MVLNLIKGTEPCKLHQCIHQPLRNWKNKIRFLQIEPCISCTPKHNSMNIYCKSMWLLLLPFRYKFRNARLHLGKCHSHIIFATKSVPFFSFHVYHPEKDCSQRYVVTNGVSISRAFLAITGYGTIWLCSSSMISSRYSSLTSAVATLNVNGCLTHAGYDSGGEVSVERLYELI